MSEHVASDVSTWLLEELAARFPGESIWVPKAEQHGMLNDWSRTFLGTPRWIAKPGSKAQYRSGALHAYELEDGFDIHRDRFDPNENAVGHFFLDAPELPLATFAAACAGLLTYYFMERRQEENAEEDRSPWLSVGVALVVAALIGLVVYVLAALLRVGLAGG